MSPHDSVLNALLAMPQPVPEPGTLDMTAIGNTHDSLMRESSLYREACGLHLVGLMSSMILRELDRLAAKPSVANSTPALFGVSNNINSPDCANGLV